MPQGKANTWTGSLPAEPVTSIHPILEHMDMRARCSLLHEVRTLSDQKEIVQRIQEYAAQAEQEIASLSSRIRLLESQSMTDDLTGLYNRRGFQKILGRTLANANRYHESGILAYLDLDHFKRINDQHGHATGDEVLRLVGRYLKSWIRKTDYAARLGGDEFAVLFVRGRFPGTQKRALELAKKINGLSIIHNRIPVTISTSLGLATYNGTTDAAKLLDMADRAMYRGKHSRAGQTN